jgi:hypothetical protein
MKPLSWPWMTSIYLASGKKEAASISLLLAKYLILSEHFSVFNVLKGSRLGVTFMVTELTCSELYIFFLILQIL